MKCNFLNLIRRVACVLAFGIFLINNVYSQENKHWRDSVDFYNYQLDIDYAKAQISDYQNYIYTNGHTQTVYDSHHQLSVYIFWVVIIIVLSGLIFSGIQFYITINSFLKNPKKNITPVMNANLNNPTEPPTVTTIKVSRDGFEISSSILGIIILALSIIFFFLYLQFVYPITFNK